MSKDDENKRHGGAIKMAVVTALLAPAMGCEPSADTPQTTPPEPAAQDDAGVSEDDVGTDPVDEVAGDGDGDGEATDGIEPDAGDGEANPGAVRG